MKLAKRMLVCLMAIAIVAVMAISASAAASVNLDATTIKVGEEATITLTASDFAGTYSGNFSVTYDPEVIEYVNATAINGGVAGNPEAGLITLAFMDMNAYTDANATLLTITVKGLKEGSANLSVSQDSYDNEAGDTEANIAPAVAAAANVAVAPAVDDETTTAKQPDPVDDETTTAKKDEPIVDDETTTAKKDDPVDVKPGDDETTTEVIPPLDDDEIIVKEKDFIKGDALDEKDAAAQKAAAAAKADKAAAAAKAAKAGKASASVPQTGDTAVAVIAGIMAIGAVGFIATKKREF